MRRGFYKHKNNTDVAMFVMKSFFVTEKNGWKVKVHWVNIVNPSKPFTITDAAGPIIETHFITREQAKGWESYNVNGSI